MNHADILLTTEHTIESRIAKRLGIITGECVYGMHLGKDFLAGVRDIFGGRSDTLQKGLREAKEQALGDLRRAAEAAGANAVIAVTLSYASMPIGNGNMIVATAVGTAVVLE